MAIENFEEIWKDFSSLKEEEPPINTSEEDDSKCFCDNQKITVNDYFYVCENCGKVLKDDYINTQIFFKDNGYIQPDIEVNKTNIFNSFHLSTTISYGYDKKTINLIKLQSIVNRSNISNKDTCIYKVKKTIEKAVYELELKNQVVETALCKFKAVDSSGIIKRGKNRKALVSVCIYLACKEMNFDIIQEKISKYFKVDNHTFQKMYLHYLENTKEQGKKRLLINKDMSAYLSDILCSINVKDFKIEKLAVKILQVIQESKEYSSYNTCVLIAGLIKFIDYELELCLDLKHLASKCNVSNVSMDKVYKQIVIDKVKIFNCLKERV